MCVGVISDYLYRLKSLKQGKKVVLYIFTEWSLLGVKSSTNHTFQGNEEEVMEGG